MDLESGLTMRDYAGSPVHLPLQGENYILANALASPVLRESLHRVFKPKE